MASMTQIRACGYGAISEPGNQRCLKSSGNIATESALLSVIGNQTQPQSNCCGKIYGHIVSESQMRALLPVHLQETATPVLKSIYSRVGKRLTRWVGSVFPQATTATWRTCSNTFSNAVTTFDMEILHTSLQTSIRSRLVMYTGTTSMTAAKRCSTL